MKNRFFSLIIFLTLLLTTSGCGLVKKLCHNDGNNSGTEIVAGQTQNMYQVNLNYTASQVDSMCVTDKLPRKLDNWISSGFIDYETNVHVTRYMYIKDLNDNYEMIYIVTPQSDMYLVSKRKVVSE